MGKIEDLISSIENTGDQLGNITLKRCLPPRRPSLSPISDKISQELCFILEQNGITSFYEHQGVAIESVLSGKDILVATSTASGKSLIYNVPVIQSFLADRASKALYLFPLKALQQDQQKNLSVLVSALEEGDRPRIEVLDGDTPQSRRRKLKQSPPDVLITNPDMLHLSILPYHATWSPFLSGLKYIIIDEVHTYRGIMGSNMAWVFRRLERILNHYGAHPRYIMCSATIGNPEQLSRLLIARPVEVISQDGAPTGKRFVVFIDPSYGPIAACLGVLEMAIRRGMRTIVYTQSRKLTELLGIWITQRRDRAFKDKVKVYRAGLLPEERRQIESDLASGRLLGVISTSALELGIDIGSLDCSILLGYPGSIMATWQRWGRAGRKLQDALVVLIAQEDALDQYIMRNPEIVLSGEPEAALLNPKNPRIMERHIECAASELPIRMDEPFVKEAPWIQDKIKEMVVRGDLLQSFDGEDVFSNRQYPHREVDLRGTGGNYRITKLPENITIGAIDESRAFRETHPGAIYLHGGKKFLVMDLDTQQKCVGVVSFHGDYFTRPIIKKETHIIEEYDARPLYGSSMHFGRIRVREEVTGFDKRSIRGQRLLGRYELDLPPLLFETEGAWIIIPKGVREAIERAFMHFMGGIHAIEHAIIGVMPFFVLTDRTDIGGISQPLHPQLRESAIFIYDGVPGGVGLTKEAFLRAELLLEKTLDTIESCPCEFGCPSCVHSPKCGSGNRPIDKASAISILHKIMSKSAKHLHLPKFKTCGKGEKVRAKISISIEGSPDSKETPTAPSRLDLDQIRYAVFDLETQLSAQEVGGWHMAHKMRVSCAVLYDSSQDRYISFLEKDVEKLVDMLAQFDLVVGFNIKRFDYKVLSRYVDPRVFKEITTLDILKEVKSRLGYRLSLDHLAQSTLGAKKAGNGLLALRWWKAGEIKKIISYCREDVRLTRDLFLHGHEKGYLLFKNKAGKTVRLPVSW